MWWHQVLDELLEGLVGEVLVPPRRQRLLQVVPEILPELHPAAGGRDSPLLPPTRSLPYQTIRFVAPASL